MINANLFHDALKMNCGRSGSHVGTIYGLGYNRIDPISLIKISMATVTL